MGQAVCWSAVSCLETRLSVVLAGGFLLFPLLLRADTAALEGWRGMVLWAAGHQLVAKVVAVFQQLSMVQLLGEKKKGGWYFRL